MKFKNLMTEEDIKGATIVANRNDSWRDINGNILTNEDIDYYSVGHFWNKLVSVGILDLPGDMTILYLDKTMLLKEVDNNERILIAMYTLYNWNSNNLKDK